MKKLLSILLAISVCSSIALGFSSCGGGGFYGDDSYYDEGEEFYDEEDDEEYEEDYEDEDVDVDVDVDADEEDIESSDKETTSAKDKVTSVAKGSDFIDGYALVEHNISDSTRKLSVINTKGEILFSIDEFSKNASFLDKELARNLGNGIMIYNDMIYNMTGEIIASPEISGYDRLFSYNIEGYVLAMKKDENFEGDIYSVGVINNKGEWEHPLSSDNPIVKSYEEDNRLSNLETKIVGQIQDGNHGDFNNDYIVAVDSGYYNIKTNKITESYNHYDMRYNNSGGDGTGVYKFDTEGNYTMVFAVDRSSSVHFLNEGVLIRDKNEIDLKLVDYSGKLLTDFSQFGDDMYISFLASCEIINGYFLGTSQNKTGARYICIFTTSGELAFDPIRMDDIADYRELTAEGLVCKVFEEDNKLDHIYYLYDFEGNKTLLELDYDMKIDMVNAFHDGLALVTENYNNAYYVNTDGEIVID